MNIIGKLEDITVRHQPFNMLTDEGGKSRALLLFEEDGYTLGMIKHFIQTLNWPEITPNRISFGRGRIPDLSGYDAKVFAIPLHSAFLAFSAEKNVHNCTDRAAWSNKR